MCVRMCLGAEVKMMRKFCGEDYKGDKKYANCSLTKGIMIETFITLICCRAEKLGCTEYSQHHNMICYEK